MRRNIGRQLQLQGQLQPGARQHGGQGVFQLRAVVPDRNRQGHAGQQPRTVQTQVAQRTQLAQRAANPRVNVSQQGLAGYAQRTGHFGGSHEMP